MNSTLSARLIAILDELLNLSCDMGTVRLKKDCSLTLAFKRIAKLRKMLDLIILEAERIEHNMQLFIKQQEENNRHEDEKSST